MESRMGGIAGLVIEVVVERGEEVGMAFPAGTLKVTIALMER